MTRTRDYEIDANTLDEMHVWVIRLRLLIQQ